MKDFKIVRSQKMGKTCHGVVSEMLVINGIVLKSLNQRTKIMILGNKNSFFIHHLQNSIDDRMNLIDMSKNVCRSDKSCRTKFLSYLIRDGRCEKCVLCWNAPLNCQFINGCGLNSENIQSARL